jgi:hypothetical protein
MRDERAAPHEAWEGDAVVAPPVCATGVSLLARGRLSGATPRGQPWTPAVTRPQGYAELSMRRMAVLWPGGAPSLGHHVHRALLRNAWLDFAPRIPATACHERNYI